MIPPSLRSAFGFCVVLAGSAGLVACQDAGADGKAIPVVTLPPGPPGQQVYEKSCARCHGYQFEGKEDAPALDAVRLSTLGDQRLRMTIQYGKGRMRGFSGLTTQQVDDLIAYLKAP